MSLCLTLILSGLYSGDREANATAFPQPETVCDLGSSGGLQDQNAKREYPPPTPRPCDVFNAYVNTPESC